MINFNTITNNIESHPILVGSILGPILVGLALILFRKIFSKKEGGIEQKAKQSMKKNPGGSQSMLQIGHVETIIMSPPGSAPTVATSEDALLNPASQNERVIKLSGNSKYICDQIEALFPGNGDSTRNNYSQAIAAIEDGEQTVAASLYLRTFNNIYHLFSESAFNSDQTIQQHILTLENQNKNIERMLLPEGEISDFNNDVAALESICLIIFGRIRK